MLSLGFKDLKKNDVNLILKNILKNSAKLIPF